MGDQIYDLANAIDDFRRARNRADLKGMLYQLKGESNQLLSYDEVRRMLRLQGGTARGIQDIPLDAIVGSVGRYTDFTRDFLPRPEVNQDRWARIKVAASGLIGLPPIEVYQIDQIYFVQDGNHRVSVARELGASYIQAYVTEVHTPVSLTPDIQPDDLILKAEYSQFLDQSNLNHLRPEADFTVTEPGQYPVLLEHIDVHRYFMGIDLQRPISYAEAAIHWYDSVYHPIVEEIKNRGILHDFPARTETDLYLWIAEHRSELEDELGFPVQTTYMINHLAEDHLPSWISRVGGKLHDLVIPENLEGGPPPGKWRGQVTARSDERLFIELLVPINGKEDGWCALEQAIRVAGREASVLHGLHVLQSDADETNNIEAVQDEFHQRCGEAGVKGKLIISDGDIVEQTIFRAAATDLIVVNLSYPPGEEPISRLQSGFRSLLHRSPRPVLATPQTVSDLNNALLSYDGSPKAREALFVTTYLARKWGITVHVLTTEDGGKVNEVIINQAREYLEKHNVKAGYHLESGNPDEAILKIVQEKQCDWVIMGGYGLSPVMEVILGSTVDTVLRMSKIPTLICR
jgi:nucleotide-binding universal stress UspA family protein